MILPLFALALAAPAPLPDCRANQLSLAFDGEGGAFDGMSHSGSLMVLRNVGPTACRVPGLPRLTLKGAKGEALPITRNAPVGMHPGPVIVPVGVAPGAELTAPLRWVSGAVYDRSRCYDVRAAAVTIGGETIQTPLRGRICGAGTAGATVDQPVLRPDPRLD